MYSPKIKHNLIISIDSIRICCKVFRISVAAACKHWLMIIIIVYKYFSSYVVFHFTRFWACSNRIDLGPQVKWKRYIEHLQNRYTLYILFSTCYIVRFRIIKGPFAVCLFSVNVSFLVLSKFSEKSRYLNNTFIPFTLHVIKFCSILS